jgi:hypothetical protein
MSLLIPVHHQTAPALSYFIYIELRRLRIGTEYFNISLSDDEVPKHLVVLCVLLFIVNLVVVADQPMNDIEVNCVG